MYVFVAANLPSSLAVTQLAVVGRKDDRENE